MQLARRHKIYIAVLGLVMAAVMLADDPSEKESASQQTKNSAKARQLKTSKKKHSKRSAALPVETHLPPACDFLAERLKKVCSAKRIEIANAKEVFGSMDAWFSHPQVTTAETSRSEIVRTFTQNHRLKSVLIGRGRETVIINDKCLSVGGQLDGFKLVSVTSQAAILESGTVRVVLKMYPADKRP